MTLYVLRTLLKRQGILDIEINKFIDDNDLDPKYLQINYINNQWI